MESVNVRNLEQIQESDGKQSGTRWSAFLLASAGCAALVIAGVMTVKRSEPPAQSTEDPLAALVNKAKRNGEPPSERVDPSDVTFPGVLSDVEKPTTALAAVKDESGKLLAQVGSEPATAPTAPPPAADKLPVVPLPAGTLLTATSVTLAPKDGLTELAKQASRVEPTPAAIPGAGGGYSIQVASFKDQNDADAFVAQLLSRGHRAFRQAAYVAERGLWHRVRVGPFKTKYAAEQYQRDFEKAERMSTFLVDPEKVKRQEEIRAAKLATRMEKYGRP
jgi:cell division septation protein DedD